MEIVRLETKVWQIFARAIVSKIPNELLLSVVIVCLGSENYSVGEEEETGVRMNARYIPFSVGCLCILKHNRQRQFGKIACYCTFGGSQFLSFLSFFILKNCAFDSPIFSHCLISPLCRLFV